MILGRVAGPRAWALDDRRGVSLALGGVKRMGIIRITELESIRHSSSGIERRRRDLRSRPGCKFVDAEEFVRLAVSSQSLVRADDPHAGLRGLLDTKTGTRFLAEEEKLFSA